MACSHPLPPPHYIAGVTESSAELPALTWLTYTNNIIVAIKTISDFGGIITLVQ